MKNGQQATIVGYHSATNIDIEFEDGTIVYGRTYQQFQKREVANPNYKKANPYAASHLGETRTMINGINATIIAYRNNRDIDIKFEDGIIRQHVRYHHFLSGKVNPISSKDRTKNDKNKRLGEKRMMNCGLECEIIEYNSAHNITVKFTNGAIAKNKYYYDFQTGIIQCPEYNGDGQLNETKKMLNGMMATIIKYESNTNIDVQFEDGEIRHNVTYNSFISGRLLHPNQITERQTQGRIGETNQMRNGLQAKIIQYNGYYNVDIQFEDGVVVQHQRYEKFKSGEVPHPNIQYNTSTSLQEFAIRYYLRELGFSKIQQGEWQDRGFGRLELDFYHAATNIAIEYDGSIHNVPKTHERDIRKNKKCKKNGVKLYRIRDPYCQTMEDNNSINIQLNRGCTICKGLIDCGEELKRILKENKIEFQDNLIDFTRDKDAIMTEYNETYINYYAKERLGEKTYSKSAKQNMTIIEYNSSTNIVVQFENGDIRRGVTYKSFCMGQICLPQQTINGQKQTRLGEQRTMNNGMLAKIIKYNSAVNIDVEFEDGVVVKEKQYSCFIRGKISHPNKPQSYPRYNVRARFREQRIGEQRTMNNGHQATITEYETSNNITIQFDNGYIRKNIGYKAFYKGEVALRNDK